MLESFAKEALLERSDEEDGIGKASIDGKQKLEAINQVTKAFVKQFGQLFDQWKK